MTLSWASRVVRGGSAVEKVYWRATNPSAASGTGGGPKLVKQSRVLRLKQTPPPPANLHTRLTATGPASSTT